MCDIFQTNQRQSAYARHKAPICRDRKFSCDLARVPARQARTKFFLTRRKKKAGPQHEVETRQFFVSTSYTPQATGKQALANEANAMEAGFSCWRCRRGIFSRSRFLDWNWDFATSTAGSNACAARFNRSGTFHTSGSDITAAFCSSSAATVAVLAVATVLTVATVLATTAVSAIAAGRAVTRMAAVATVPGLSLLLTAQEGDTDDRDEHRNPKSHRTIHLQILQTNRYLSVRRNDPFAAALSLPTPMPRRPAARDASNYDWKNASYLPAFNVEEYSDCVN